MKTVMQRHPTARGPRPQPAPRKRAPAPGTYVLLVATIAVLNVVGLVMVLSASSVISLTSHGSAWYYFERQLVWTLVGIVGFIIVQRIDYRRWRSVVRPLMFVDNRFAVLKFQGLT